MNESIRRQTLVVILFAISAIAISINFHQKKTNDRLKNTITIIGDELSDMENSVEQLEDEKALIQEELDVCIEERDDIEVQSNFNSSNNWSLQDQIYYLEREIDDLQDDLSDCEYRLRNCD